MTRLVVVLAGPPGSGKTTVARANPLGLEVFDADDRCWSSQAAFGRAIAALAFDPAARAVVIRSAATSSARLRWRAMTQATHCYLLTVPAQESAARIRERRRIDEPGTDLSRQLRAVRAWWAQHDQADGVPVFPGWDHLGPPSVPPSRHDPRVKYPSQIRGYGAEHRRVRAGYARRMAAGEVFTCRWCLRVVDPAGPWDLGHRDGQAGWSGPEHVHCNRGAGARQATRSRLENADRWLKANLVRGPEPRTRSW